jgi:hypothetical protein
MKKTKIIALAGGAALAAVALSACTGSHIQPSLGQYGITTGHGNFSSQQVIHVTPPGADVHLGSGTTTWYIYSDVRNYVTGPDGDRAQSSQEITGPGSGSDSGPGMPDYVQSYLAFEVNPAIQKQKNNWGLASSFLSFCLKYACAEQTPQNDDSNASLTRSSSPGWENMLNEIMPVAIDNATRVAIAQQQPSLWNSTAAWPGFGNAIAGNLQQDLAQLGAGDAGTPYFCGPGSTETTCAPFIVTIRAVTPVNPAIVAAYNQEITAQYQEKAAAVRLAAAKAAYGPDADWFLGMQDLESSCPSKCTFYVGNAPVNPGS